MDQSAYIVSIAKRTANGWVCSPLETMEFEGDGITLGCVGMAFVTV